MVKKNYHLASAIIKHMDNTVPFASFLKQAIALLAPSKLFYFFLISFVILLLGTSKPGYADQNIKKQAQTKDPVVLINRGTDSKPIFDIRNNMFAPIEFELSADEFINMKSEPPLPIRKVIPANSTAHLSKLSQIQPDQTWSYTYTTRYVLGTPKARHLTGKPYRLPFGNIHEFLVSQAYEGERSHQHLKTKYAVDIEMPEKTKIYAARTGTVVEITNEHLDDSRKGVPPYLIRILHNDGTMAVYAHLQKGSATVGVGQKVHRGELIAISGPSYVENVKPHLHFIIQRNAGMKLESVPFQFLGANNTPITAKHGMQLRHPAY